MKYKLYFNKAQDEELTQVQAVDRLLQGLGYERTSRGNDSVITTVTFTNPSGKYIDLFTYDRGKEIASITASYPEGDYFTEEEAKMLMDIVYDRSSNTDSIVSHLRKNGYNLTHFSRMNQMSFHKKMSDNSSPIEIYVNEARKLVSAYKVDDYRHKLALEPAIGKFFDFLGYEYDNYSAEDPISIEDWFE